MSESSIPLKSTVSLNDIPESLPLLPIRDIVVFPGMVLPLAVGREKSIRALEDAMKSNRLIFLTAQKSVRVDDPKESDLYPIGTVCEVLQLIRIGDGTCKILVAGICRAKITGFQTIAEKLYVQSKIKLLPILPPKNKSEYQALMRQTLSLFTEFAKLNRRIPEETLSALESIDDPGQLADALSIHLALKTTERQKLLEVLDVEDQVLRIVEILSAEIEILNLEKKIQNRVRTQIEKSQKEYYLTEQMKAIQKELRQKDDFSKEAQDLRIKIKELKMTPEAEEAANKECDRLEKMMPYSPEATVVRNYLDWMVHLPWSQFSTDNNDLNAAEKILNAEHHGLEKAKERILEYLSTIKLVKKIRGPILCFVGPPGVGKTSLARSVANALNRNFTRISLGGVRDESEIRGHRRTYIGSMPGRIIQSLKKIKTRNPVFLLDEIDKMGSDWRGDPTSALLEVLDPEQNNNFMDHYLDVGFDLSDILFITTANTLHSIPSSLQDRLEIIRFPGYLESEKTSIAKNFLIPRQIKEHGLDPAKLEIRDDTVLELIRNYTREAGVRNLERLISKICRKAAREVAQKNNEAVICVKQADVVHYLGVMEYHRDENILNGIGTATGLAWTEHGGELLNIEVTSMEGKGKIILTGKLGDVMQESAQAAISYVRSNAKKLRLPVSFFKNKDIHIHVPEGAVPKDGPSAGVAICMALISHCTNKPIKKELAVTGEITLRGNILPIGGLKEKSMAAHRAGVKTVLYPFGNEKDLSEIPVEISQGLKLIPLKTMDEALKAAFNGYYKAG